MKYFGDIYRFSRSRGNSALSFLGEMCCFNMHRFNLSCIYYMYLSENLKCFQILVAASGAIQMPDPEAWPDLNT